MLVLLGLWWWRPRSTPTRTPAARHLPPRLGLDGAAAARDLHHARAAGPPDRPGQAHPIGLPAGLWLAFAAWMVVGVVEGTLYHNVLRRSSTRPRTSSTSSGGTRWPPGYRCAGTSTVVTCSDSATCPWCARRSSILHEIARVTINTTLPLLPLQDFRRRGDETAALFLGIGTMCFLTRLASGPIRFRHVLALVPIVVSALLATSARSWSTSPWW